MVGMREINNSRTLLISLGSNLGDRVGQLLGARQALELALGVKVSASRIYSSAPVYDLEQPEFLNAVLRAEVAVDSVALLAQLQEIELAAGKNKTRPKGPRTLDLDILVNGADLRAGEDPLLPHPRLHERAFVLFPLRDVYPDFCHPVSGLTIEQMLTNTLDDHALVVPEEFPAWRVG